ncbi:MAG: N-acetylglucosamine-6-phosphate deacetylase [Chitinophagaceae bacterium]|uniref:N-acetylglucosamine-6-phosphate deacetylase n=1 Tax=unclassified Paraflavitalea TaxID=2798305 RepID=UPI003D34B91F|nr:N-acetylglucosamine-6-phosphate deacetylase [Chitinophagaceae bacterium]
MSKINIINGTVISEHGLIPGGQVIVDNGKISAVNSIAEPVLDAQTIDASGLYVSPGFIDIHVHGGAGFDFMDGTEEAFLAIAELHAQFGTTAMLPTTLSGSKEELLDTLNAYRNASKMNKKGASFIGLHLEGPYFAMSQRGAQDPQFIRDPNPIEYKEILALGPFIKRWSAAPELEGALEFGRFLVSKGVLPSMAHTDAIYEEAVEAFKNGYSLATHFYSAMSGVTRRNAFRYAGVIEAGYMIDEMDVEIIADGVHLPEPLLRMVVKFKDPSRIILITDAMRAAGLNTTESILGSIKNGMHVLIEDGVAKLPDRSAFAGSVATADRLVRTMLSKTSLDLVSVVKMITENPARVMNVLHSKGSLKEGKDADIVLFDDTISIKATFVEGRLIYSK